MSEVKIEVSPRPSRLSFEDWLYRKLGQYDGFYTHPPLDHRKMYIHKGDYRMVVCLNNDGGETWIGTENEWHTHMKNEEFRKVCFWFLWTWAWIDWFGLRSWVWYKLLHRRVNRAMPKDKK